MTIEQWSKMKESYSTLSMVLWSLYIDLLIYITQPLKRCTHLRSTVMFLSGSTTAVTLPVSRLCFLLKPKWLCIPSCS